MGSAGKPEPVRLFMAVMFRPDVEIGRVHDMLGREYGPVGFSCGPLPFTFSDYYETEMGPGLLKSYLVFAAPADRELLPQVKVRTNALEQEWARQGRRTVNLDPGYLSRDKLVLASTKNFFHRLYLGSGVYGEVTLHFRRNQCRHFSWTYPDFRTEVVQEMVLKARAALAAVVSTERNRPG